MRKRIYAGALAAIMAVSYDDDDPIFYRDHWSKKGKFSSTKEQTVTIKFDEENVKGFYLYLDATSSDKVNKKTKYTFKITNVDFE